QLMPANFKAPTELVVSKIPAVTGIHVTGIFINTGQTQASVAVSLEADVQESPGIETTTRRALPNVEFSGDALGELLVEATQRTIEARSIYVGIRDTVYARLKALGVVPEDADISTGGM